VVEVVEQVQVPDVVPVQVGMVPVQVGMVPVVADWDPA